MAGNYSLLVFLCVHVSAGLRVCPLWAVANKAALNVGTHVAAGILMSLLWGLCLDLELLAHRGASCPCPAGLPPCPWGLPRLAFSRQGSFAAHSPTGPRALCARGGPHGREAAAPCAFHLASRGRACASFPAPGDLCCFCGEVPPSCPLARFIQGCSTVSPRSPCLAV